LTGQLDGFAFARVKRLDERRAFALPVGAAKIAQLSTAAAISPQRCASNL
jgi:hypothetical protein